MGSFNSELDILNRALQQCGARQITALTDQSENAFEAVFAYDKLRDAELRRNLWTFSIKLAALRPIQTTTLLLAPALYSSTTTYHPGAIVQDAKGAWWTSSQSNNLANAPGNSLAWDIYFGPRTVAPYDPTTTYFAGELVYTTNNQGVAFVFLSLMNGNASSPLVGGVYSATTTYMRGQVASEGGWAYESLFDLNTGNDPASAPVAWNLNTTYAAAARVTGADGLIYYSLAAGNLGHDPTLDTLNANWGTYGVKAAWASNYAGGTTSTGWVGLNATLAQLNILYPLGCGPGEDAATNNVYVLPNAFLRMAPQSPRAGSNSILGAPSGLSYTDWVLQSGYIVTRTSDPIILRFGADMSQVPMFDPMFCEGLAARIGYEIVERLTQAIGKRQQIAGAYKQFMMDARQVNGIEQGPTESPEDDYITCRI